MVHHCKVLFVYLCILLQYVYSNRRPFVCVYDVRMQRHNNRRFEVQDPVYTKNHDVYTHTWSCIAVH